MSFRIQGTGVALVTPFKNGGVDFNALQTLINHVVDGGVEHLISLGTTGESATLSTEEKHDVLRATVEYAAGRVSVIGGFGGNNTNAVIKAIEAAPLDGVSGILSVSPYYNKPSQRGIVKHYTAIADAAPLPVVLYNVPGRTTSNIAVGSTLQLAQHNNIIGIKEASGDLGQCMHIVNDRPQGFEVVSGDDNLTLPMLSFGMDGVISVIANAFPRIYSDMVRLGIKGDFDAARELHFKVLRFIDLLFVEGNPCGVKAALEILGICSEEVRQPLATVSVETYKLLEKEIQTITSA